MARPKKGSPSKKAIVEKYLAQGLPNHEVVQAAKAKDKVTVSPTYVSVIKSKLNKANGRPKLAKRGRVISASGAYPALSAAIELVKVAGSMAAAKEVLAAIDEIRQFA